MLRMVRASLFLNLKHRGCALITLLSAVLLILCILDIILDYEEEEDNKKLETQNQDFDMQYIEKRVLSPAPAFEEKPIDWIGLFWFVPPKVSDCRDLFRYTDNPSKRHYTFPDNYRALKSQFDRYLSGMLNNMKIKGVEGNSGDMTEQSLAYYSLANASFVKTICETGFNAGHSAFNWLASNADANVYSFDLGEHGYSKPMASYLRSVFDKRLAVYWGDSKLSVPAFSRQFSDLYCDIIVVDGGHRYADAKADLDNFRAHARPERHLLIIDDHPTKVLAGVRQAWEEEVRAGRIEEHFKCTFYPGGWRGFTVGKYTNLS